MNVGLPSSLQPAPGRDILDAPVGDDSLHALGATREKCSRLAAHTDSLMALPGVVGTAIGLCDGVPCIRVFLADSTAAARRKIPGRLEGYRVNAEVTGPMRARGEQGRPPP